MLLLLQQFVLHANHNAVRTKGVCKSAFTWQYTQVSQCLKWYAFAQHLGIKRNHNACNSWSNIDNQFIPAQHKRRKSYFRVIPHRLTSHYTNALLAQVTTTKAHIYNMNLLTSYRKTQTDTGMYLARNKNIKKFSAQEYYYQGQQIWRNYHNIPMLLYYQHDTPDALDLRLFIPNIKLSLIQHFICNDISSISVYQMVE